METLTINRSYLNYAAQSGQPYPRDQVRVTLYFKGKDGGYSQLFPQSHPITRAKAGDVIEAELEIKGNFKNFHLPKEGQRSETQRPAAPAQPAGNTQLDRIEKKLGDVHGRLNELFMLIADDKGHDPEYDNGPF